MKKCLMTYENYYSFFYFKNMFYKVQKLLIGRIKRFSPDFCFENRIRGGGGGWYGWFKQLNSSSKI